MPDGACRDGNDSLKALRQTTRDMLAGCTDADARGQYHPDLSPLAWHLGHVFFVETYWLREVVCGDARATAPWHELFFPEFNPKSGRAQRLPPLNQIMDWTRALETGNRPYWEMATTSDDPLMANDYLTAFLRQHYAQHLETMALAHRQSALTQNACSDKPILGVAAMDMPTAVCVPGGAATVGSDNAHTYDNEQPAHSRPMADFRITAAPVSNSQWLAFIEDGGYQRDALWTDRGRAWRDNIDATPPQHWRCHAEGWVCPDPAEPLEADAPVHGISAHEADAFARWSGARLAHEHEYEHAIRTGALTPDSSVWIWCANTLFPYPGFRAFPYQGYSVPWFDGTHRVLRGASGHTHPLVRRATFRNFYPESHRHIHAGLHLAWSG